MPFKKVNEKEEVRRRLENDADLSKAFEYVQKEYEVIKQLIAARNEMGLTQTEVAKESGLTQQMISRIETIENSPTFRNFIKYVDSLGFVIRIERNHRENRR